jgi:hypothetical protein
MSGAKLRIGWAQADITPDEPVLIAGQRHSRVSEGVRDPVTATALVLEQGGEHAVLVSWDLASASDELCDAVRERVAASGGPAPEALVMFGTHTHAAPAARMSRYGQEYHPLLPASGVELDVMSPEDYVCFAADRVAAAVQEAWEKRAEGSVAFGLGQAVVGRNRRWVDIHGNTTMYGNTDTPEFSHTEGYEDHSVNVLATYDSGGDLTGVIVNIACPAQETEHLFEISADFWHEAREEMRRRLGDGLFVLPQCSPAGDQSPHLLWGKREHERMLELKGRDSREEIGHRIADAVEEVVGFLGGTEDDAPVLMREQVTLELPMRLLTEEDVRDALEDAAKCREKWQAELAKLEADPSLREEPRWYVKVTDAYHRMRWYERVEERFELQQRDPIRSITLSMVRLGDVAFATNPFEYYLDYGVYIKARSPAVQNFLVQLAGPTQYLPSARSIGGGGYGSVPASTTFGPDAGREIADVTLDTLFRFWGVEDH